MKLSFCNVLLLMGKTGNFLRLMNLKGAGFLTGIQSSGVSSITSLSDVQNELQELDTSVIKTQVAACSCLCVKGQRVISFIQISTNLNVD